MLGEINMLKLDFDAKSSAATGFFCLQQYQIGSLPLAAAVLSQLFCPWCDQYSCPRPPLVDGQATHRKGMDKLSPPLDKLFVPRCGLVKINRNRPNSAKMA